MKVLDSKSIQDAWKEDLKQTISEIEITPCLAIIQVKGDKASDSYIKSKIKIAGEIGIDVNHILLEEVTPQEEIMEILDILNDDERINGIIVQLPLPKHLYKDEILDAIAPEKDVDGLGTIQKGMLRTNITDAYVPCTALGVLRLIEATLGSIGLKGKDVVIVNRSELIGNPLQEILTQKNATVTVCHRYTNHLPSKMKAADIVITGIGKANYFNRDYFKAEQIIIDCGMNRDDNGKLVGDIDIDDVKEMHIKIASGKGHTGLLTVLALMNNVIKACFMQMYF